MQLTLHRSNYWKTAIFLLVVAIGIGAYSYLSNKVCLFCPVEIPLDYETNDHVHTVVNSKGVILLFRGVHAQHPDLLNAKIGIATPIGGHDSPYLHNRGTNESVFTSWTSNIWIANTFASKKGKGGIILAKHFHESQLISSPDKHQQSEFLIRGSSRRGYAHSCISTLKNGKNECYFRKITKIGQRTYPFVKHWAAVQDAVLGRK